MTHQDRSRRLKIGIVCAAALLAACGDDREEQAQVSLEDSAASSDFRVTLRLPLASAVEARGGTLFSIVSAGGAVQASAGIVKTWNSYCASHPLLVHFYLGESARFPVARERIGSPDPSVKTAYGFSLGESLFVVDRGNWRQYEYSPGAQTAEWREVSPENTVSCPAFTHDGWTYPQSGNAARACRYGDDGVYFCDEMPIREGTFSYAFADAEGKVVTVTNWGDVLIHGPEGWCRAAEEGDSYSCPPADAPPAPAPEQPRGFQFYSSIKYRGETLLGRFPGGVLYRFDGTRLAPYEDTPPLPPGEIRDNAEAQSMASYCGDLYVGFWPRGAIWVRSLRDNTWSRHDRLFTHPKTPQPGIPYYGSEPPEFPGAFFGQRISALTLMGEKLFLTTSNLREWVDGTATPDFLSLEQIAEYGAVHALHRPGCVSAQLDEAGDELLHFDFEPTRIGIRQGDRLLTEISNPGYMPSSGDRIVTTSPVFGEALAEIVSYPGQ